jgi:hypothetical protein
MDVPRSVLSQQQWRSDMWWERTTVSDKVNLSFARVIAVARQCDTHHSSCEHRSRDVPDFLCMTTTSRWKSTPLAGLGNLQAKGKWQERHWMQQ